MADPIWINDPSLRAAGEEEKKKNRTEITVIDPTTLDGLPVPPRQWLVGDWIPMARATALYGPLWGGW